MSHVAQLPPRNTPRVTFSALVDILSQPSHRLPAIIKPQKYPKPGPVFGYKKATAQLVDWFVNGTPLDPTDPGLRDHEIDVLDAANNAGGKSALWPVAATSASHPPNSSVWSVAGVEISFAPDVLLRSSGGSTGALKLYLRKDPTAVGPTMAALLYYHRAQIACDPNTDPALCAVTDVQCGLVHVATGSFQRLVAQVQSACQVVAATWPFV